jgi:MBG domain
MLKLKSLLVLFLFVAYLTSCNTTSDDVLPEKLTGKWKVTTFNFLISAKDEAPIKYDWDFSKNLFIYNFKSDGTYEVSLDESGKKQILNSDLDIDVQNGGSGTYDISEKGFIKFTTTNANGEKSSQKLRITFSDNKITLDIDKALYLATVKEELNKQKLALATLGFTVEQFFKEIEASIIEFKYQQVLVKV